MNIHTKCELIVEDKLVMSWYLYEICISISGGVSINGATLSGFHWLYFDLWINILKSILQVLVYRGLVSVVEASFA